VDGDVEVTFIRGSGPGGQHRNRRETGVRLRHVPTGIVVTATERRERAKNLAVAHERLRERLRERQRRRNRKPRKKTRPTLASQRRRLEQKRRRARTKQRRRPPSRDE